MANIITLINHTRKQILRIKYEDWIELFSYINEEMPTWELNDDIILRTDGGTPLTYLVDDKSYDVRNVSDI